MVELQTSNLKVAGSSPASGVLLFYCSLHKRIWNGTVVLITLLCAADEYEEYRCYSFRGKRLCFGATHFSGFSDRIGCQIKLLLHKMRMKLYENA